MLLFLARRSHARPGDNGVADWPAIRPPPRSVAPFRSRNLLRASQESSRYEDAFPDPWLLADPGPLSKPQFVLGQKSRIRYALASGLPAHRVPSRADAVE